ncbi:MAG: hypothetical protein P1P88_13510 [Bacteroidales bacterium]|nr:hypothetical protein [Bacteroidales bacterium]
MKLNIFKKLMYLILTVVFFNGCVQQGEIGPQGPAGQDGQDGLDGGAINVYYSQWYTPTSWEGQSGDWFFDVTDDAINESIVEAGIMLAYMSVPMDLYEGAVRPMPAYAVGANWDFLIPAYGQMEFTCDSQNAPGTTDHFFRFVLIPPGTQLKSTNKSTQFLTKEDLLNMEYADVCKLLGIPE